MVTSGFGIVPEEWVRAGRGFGDGSDLLAAGVDAFCRVVGGQPFGGDELGRALFEGDAKAAGFVQRRDRLLTELSVTVNVLRRMGAGLVESGVRYRGTDQRIADELAGRWNPAPPPGVPASVREYRHAPVPGGLPSSVPPPGLVREALWVFEAVGFGFAWPDGDPDAVRALQRAVVVLRGVVGEVAGETGGHSRRVTGSGFGAATEAFGADARVVDGVLADLEQWCADLADYCRAAEAAILSAQRHFLASAVFVVGLMYAVSVLGPFMEAGLAVALPLIRLEGLALRIVSRLLYEAVIGTAFSGGLDAIDQAFRPGDFSWKELAGAMGQGALAGGLMGLAHAGLPALGSRSPALAALARLMEAPGARGVMTRFAVGGTIGTTAMATAGAAAGHGWDLKHAAETGFGMAFIGAGTELAGHAFRPAMPHLEDTRTTAQNNTPGRLVFDSPAGAMAFTKTLGGDTGAAGGRPTGGGGRFPSRWADVFEDGSGTWALASENDWWLGASVFRGSDLDRVTALTATTTPEGPALHVRLRPRFDRPEEFLHIPLDGSPPTPITDTAAQRAVIRQGPAPAADRLANAGFRPVVRYAVDGLWEYSPPDGGTHVMASIVDGQLRGIWRNVHPELSAYLTVHRGFPRGREVVAGPYMQGDLTGLWQGGALRFGLSELRPDRITHVEVRPGATADDLRPTPTTTTTPTAEQALTEPLRVIDRLRELGAFPHGETAEFQWGPDRFRVHTTRTEATAPGTEDAYRYEVTRTGHHTRLVFDSTDLHHPTTHQPTTLTEIFGDHARPPRPDPHAAPRATQVTPGGYGTFRLGIVNDPRWPDPVGPLAEAHARVDAAVADMSTDPNLQPEERWQRIGELAEIAKHADRALSLARQEQRWVDSQELSDHDPGILALNAVTDEVLAVHRSVHRYAEKWAHSGRPGAPDVADLDPLSKKALGSEMAATGNDLRLPILDQAKIAALAERIFNPDGTNPEFGRYLRRWLVSSVALREDAMRMYMGDQAEELLHMINDWNRGFVTADRRWVVIDFDHDLATVAGAYFHEIIHTTQAPIGPLLSRLARSRQELDVLFGVGSLELEMTAQAVQRRMLLEFAGEDTSWQAVSMDDYGILGAPGPLYAVLSTHGTVYIDRPETAEAVRELLGDGNVPGASWDESCARAISALGGTAATGSADLAPRPRDSYMDTPVLYDAMKKLGFPLAPPDPRNPNGHLAAILDLAGVTTVPDFPIAFGDPGPLRLGRSEAGTAGGEPFTFLGEVYRPLGIHDTPDEQILGFHVSGEPATPVVQVLSTRDLFTVDTASGAWTECTAVTYGGWLDRFVYRDERLWGNSFLQPPEQPDGLTVWQRGTGPGSILAVYRGSDLTGLYQWAAPVRGGDSGGRTR